VCAWRRDGGPYDNEGAISKLLCRKLLSCAPAAGRPPPPLSRPPPGREVRRERERERGTDERTEASRYGNVIWGLCLLVYYCGNNGRHVVTSLSYNHVRNPRGSSGIRRRCRIPESPLVSSLPPPSPPCSSSRRCPAFGYAGTTVTRSTALSLPNNAI